jgi:hypothetical protein
MLRARVAPLQAYIDKSLAKPPPLAEDQERMSPEQASAASWSRSIATFLNNHAALHPRCGACSVLMGPGHVEEGTEAFCRTHNHENGWSRASSFDGSSANPLIWIAEQTVQ